MQQVCDKIKQANHLVFSKSSKLDISKSTNTRWSNFGLFRYDSVDYCPSFVVPQHNSKGNLSLLLTEQALRISPTRVANLPVIVGCFSGITLTNISRYLFDSSFRV